MNDSLPNFDKKSRSELDVDTKGWERFDIYRAIDDWTYLNAHQEEARRFLEGNLKTGSFLLLEALKIANGLMGLDAFTIPNDILTYSLKMGEKKRGQALIYMNNTEEVPKLMFVPILKLIISQGLENELEGRFNFRVRQAIRVLGRYNTSDTIEFLKKLPENELIGADDLVRKEVEKVLSQE